MNAASGSLSLRRRVMAALVAIVALFVVMQGVLAFISLHDQEDELADQLVLAEAQRIAARVVTRDAREARLADLLAPGTNFGVWLVEPDGDEIPEPVPNALRTLADGPHRPDHDGTEWHVVVLSTAAGRLFVQYDATQSEEEVVAFGLYLIGLGLLCIALAALAARYLAAIVVAPIHRITDLLAGWAPGTASQEAFVSDEEHRLLDAFRRVQARFEQGIADEREFIANLRHEIRTPLTALRTDLEMLGLSDTPDTPGWVQRMQRVQRAIGAVDAIAGSMEAARALSHSQRTEATPVALKSCVTDAWVSLGDYPEQCGLQLSVEVPDGVAVHADRHALLTILRNLMRNAAEHAAPARCTVRWSPDGIEVEDDGPGINSADLPFVFDRYYRGRLADAPGQPSDGERGLGLAIARQLADLNGWHLTVEPAQPHGSRFVLSL